MFITDSCDKSPRHTFKPGGTCTAVSPRPCFDCKHNKRHVLHGGGALNTSCLWKKMLLMSGLKGLRPLTCDLRQTAVTLGNSPGSNTLPLYLCIIYVLNEIYMSRGKEFWKNFKNVIFIYDASVTSVCF